MATSLQQQQSLGVNVDPGDLHQLADLHRRMGDHAEALEAELHQVHNGDTAASMNHCAGVLLPRLLQLRDAVDQLENLVDDDQWPLPSYREMLFVR